MLVMRLYRRCYCITEEQTQERERELLGEFFTIFSLPFYKPTPLHWTTYRFVKAVANCTPSKIIGCNLVASGCYA